MGEIIHRKNTPDGPRYRLWSTVSDSYITDEMTRDQCASEIRARAAAFAVLDADREMERRFVQCDARGTSSLVPGNDRDMSEWEQEKCEECSGFHHKFVPGFVDPALPNHCQTCGELEDDLTHGSCPLYDEDEA